MIKKILLWTLFLLILNGFLFVEDSKADNIFDGNPIKMSAYTQVRYTYQEVGINAFSIKRARVSLKGEIIENIFYNFQIDVVKSPILCDAKISLAFIPHATISFGQFKVPFSLENTTSSLSLDTINRSNTVEKLSPGRDIGTRGRDIGITLSGNFSNIAYHIGVFNGAGANNKETNDQKDIAARLVLSLADSIYIGASHYIGKFSQNQGTPAVTRNRTGFDIHLLLGPLSIKGEYINAQDDLIKKHGWYIQGSFSLSHKKSQIIFRYDSYDENKNNPGDRLDVILVGLNWFFSNKTRLQINYERHKEESLSSGHDVVIFQLQAGF